MSLLHELKRRNVIRTAGLYLVGAWLLTQVATTVLPLFDVPGWTLRALVIVLVLGFVPASIFAWVFELTLQGFKRDEEVEPGESIAPQTARRMDLTGLVLLVFRRKPESSVALPRHPSRFMRSCRVAGMASPKLQLQGGRAATDDLDLLRRSWFRSSNRRLR